MKTLFLASLALIICSFNFTNSSKLSFNKHNYSSFDSSMVIKLYHGGGMRYESLDIIIRYDSCIRIDMEQGIDHRTGFAMNDEYRKRVLVILEENNAFDLSSKPTGFAHDKATTEICINVNEKTKHCVSSGASKEIDEKSKANFSRLWDKLNAFSINKGDVKKQ